jgi:hypothetical protein
MSAGGGHLAHHLAPGIAGLGVASLNASDLNGPAGFVCRVSLDQTLRLTFRVAVHRPGSGVHPASASVRATNSSGQWCPKGTRPPRDVRQAAAPR